MSKINRSDFVVGVADDGQVIADAFPPATEQEILAVEQLVGASLPADYRKFLMSVNGGAINPDVVEDVCINIGEPFLGNAKPRGAIQGLNYLYTLSADTLNKFGMGNVLTFKWMYGSYKGKRFDYPHTPEDFIPIGNTPVESGQIVLGIRGEHRGKVAMFEYMDFETPLEDVFHIADSFDEFLDGLFPC